jgi:hypothetical protein
MSNYDPYDPDDAARMKALQEEVMSDEYRALNAFFNRSLDDNSAHRPPRLKGVKYAGERDYFIKSPAIHEQVQAAIREANMTGVGVMQGGKHIPTADIYRPNHIIDMANKPDDKMEIGFLENIRFVVSSDSLDPALLDAKRKLNKDLAELHKLQPSKLLLDMVAQLQPSCITESPVSQVLRKMEEAKKKAEAPFYPRLRPVKASISGMTEWQADESAHHARGMTPATAYDALARYIGVRRQSRPSSYRIPRTLEGVQQKRSIAALPSIVVVFPTGAARWKASLDGKASYGPTPTAALRALMAQINMKDIGKAGGC